MNNNDDEDEGEDAIFSSVNLPIIKSQKMDYRGECVPQLPIPKPKPTPPTR